MKVSRRMIEEIARETIGRLNENELDYLANDPLWNKRRILQIAKHNNVMVTLIDIFSPKYFMLRCRNHSMSIDVYFQTEMGGEWNAYPNAPKGYSDYRELKSYSEFLLAIANLTKHLPLL